MKLAIFSFFTKKILLYCAVVAGGAVVLNFVFLGNGGDADEILDVRPELFVQEVSVSGKVVAAKSVDLVFSQAGRVSSVRAQVGDAVVAGTILATLENNDARAEILQKEAAYDAARAKLKSLQEGTRPEQIAISESEVLSAETALAQAKQTLVDAVRNAYTQSDDAVRRRVDQFMLNPRSSAPTLNIIVETQLKTNIESERFRMESILTSWKSSLDIVDVSSDLSAVADTATKNLNQTRAFLDKAALAVNSLTASQNLSQATVDSYRADITTGRTNLNTAITTLTAALTSEKNAETALATEKREFELDVAGVTREDIEVEEANVKAAEADLLSAEAKFQKTLVTAPFAGIVTKMDVKVGGSASSNESNIAMISADTLQIESFVPEINSPLLEVGDEAVVVLDAYGSEVPFQARVVSIDPAETVRDGVSTYRAKLQFTDRDARIKSGMTANVVITTDKRQGVLAVPQGVVFSREGKKYVYVKTEDVVSEREVKTGSVSSLGSVEILSGLSEGDRVVLNRSEE